MIKKEVKLKLTDQCVAEDLQIIAQGITGLDCNQQIGYPEIVRVSASQEQAKQLFSDFWLAISHLAPQIINYDDLLIE